MKKFLCYDTNDAASGKINVDSRGVLKPNSTVPSGGEPYQQLVTDGTGTAKWEDRLAYAETKLGEIVPETTVTFSDMGGLMGANFPDSFNPEEGVPYRITWDGETYECLMYDCNGYPALGNLDIANMGEDTGEPFVMVYNDTAWMTGTANTSTAHLISISGLSEVVKKIDAKYVDMSNVRALVRMPDNKWTYEYAKEILDSGRLPYMQMSLDWGAFIMFPCQDATGQTSPAYITFASFVSCDLMDYGYARVAYLKLVKGEGTPKVGDVKIYDLPRSNNGKSITVKSSTSGSTKKFKITVDDSGAISATEVTS